VARADGDNLVVRLAVPNRNGLLIVSDTEVKVKSGDIELVNALMQEKRVRRFEAGVEIGVEKHEKFQILTEPKSDIPIDYLNVKVAGHASTFGTPTDRDRGGDYVLPGAFDDTLKDFRQNPVMLINHDNMVQAIAGSWTKLVIDSKGLGVVGDITNAPGMRDTRFKLIEGHLKGLSIGGIWNYTSDGFGIEEAELFEISLVAVPMNPKTLAQTASIGELECRKAFSKFWRNHSSLRSE
jgi:HK97 family phage prohead protease